MQGFRNTSVPNETTVCPRCRGVSYRVRRGLYERIVNPGPKTYRYQCDSYLCSDREHEYNAGFTNEDVAPYTMPTTSGCACPRCGGETFRIERKMIDLLISHISVVHRYQCDSRRCGWTGLVRQAPRENHSSQ